MYESISALGEFGLMCGFIQLNADGDLSKKCYCFLLTRLYK